MGGRGASSSALNSRLSNLKKQYRKELANIAVAMGYSEKSPINSGMYDRDARGFFKNQINAQIKLDEIKHQIDQTQIQIEHKKRKKAGQISWW